jgi:L-rhamnose mutarotase
MKRFAFKMKLKAGCIEEYKKRHDKIWPEVKQLLAEAGISDYSIFFDEETDTLFAVQKIAGQKGSQDLGKSETIKKWWVYMADIMDTNPDYSPISTPLEEIFYME